MVVLVVSFKNLVVSLTTLLFHSWFSLVGFLRHWGVVFSTTLVVLFVSENHDSLFRLGQEYKAIGHYNRSIDIFTTLLRSDAFAVLPLIELARVHLSLQVLLSLCIFHPAQCYCKGAIWRFVFFFFFFQRKPTRIDCKMQVATKFNYLATLYIGASLKWG